MEPRAFRDDSAPSHLARLGDKSATRDVHAWQVIEPAYFTAVAIKIDGCLSVVRAQKRLLAVTLEHARKGILGPIGQHDIASETASLLLFHDDRHMLWRIERGRFGKPGARLAAASRGKFAR